jgi:hypothetical protein
MFILIFRYFKELTAGTITGKPAPLYRQTFNFGGKSASMDSFSDIYSNSRGHRLALQKGDARLEKVMMRLSPKFLWGLVCKT